MNNEKSLTRNQTLVLGVLTKSGAPLSAYDILDRLRAEGIKAPLQVYRALEVLIDRGITHRLESLNAFVACADINCQHNKMTGFVICEKCGKADEFLDNSLHNRIKKIAGAQGFQPVHSVVEIIGVCAKCA